MDSTHPQSAAPSRVAIRASARANASAPDSKPTRALSRPRARSASQTSSFSFSRGPSTNRSDNARAKSGRTSATRRRTTVSATAEGSSCVAMTSSSSSDRVSASDTFSVVGSAGGFAGRVRSVTSATAATPRSARSAASPPSASSCARGTSVNESSSFDVVGSCSSSRATKDSIVTVKDEVVVAPSRAARRRSSLRTSVASPRRVVRVARSGRETLAAARRESLVGRVSVVSSAPSRTRTRARGSAASSSSTSPASAEKSSPLSASASAENAESPRKEPLFSLSSSANAVASAAAAISAHGAMCAAACATSAAGSAQPPNPENSAVARRHALRVATEIARRSFSAFFVTSSTLSRPLADETSDRPGARSATARSRGAVPSSASPEKTISDDSRFADASASASNGNRRKCATVRSLRSAASIPLNARATFSRCFSSAAATSATGATALGPPVALLVSEIVPETPARANTIIRPTLLSSSSVSNPPTFPVPDSCSVAAICRARVVNQLDSSTRRFFSSLNRLPFAFFCSASAVSNVASTVSTPPSVRARFGGGRRRAWDDDPS